jgi:uncharacterized membrane protein YadS
MSSADTNSAVAARPNTSGWSELWRKEDWWAIWIGLGIVLIAYILFVIASAFITWAMTAYSLADYNKTVVPVLVASVKDLRTWAFIFCFLSIGLTTRFRELAHAGRKPFLAFSTGVVVNVILGFILSAFVFASHWANLAR